MEKDDDKAALVITIDLKRIPDTRTMLDVGWRIATRYPSKARRVIAHSDLVGNLSVETSPIQMNLADVPQQEVENVVR